MTWWKTRAYRASLGKRLLTRLRVAERTNRLRVWKMSTRIWQLLTLTVGFSEAISVEKRSRSRRARDLESGVVSESKPESIVLLFLFLF